LRTTRWQRWSGLLFIMPWLITFLWFTLGPFIASIYLSFTNYRFIGLPTWIGFQNYANLFGDDPKFIRSIINTLYYTGVHVPGVMLLAFFVALLLNQKVKGQPIYRTAFYLPSVTAGVATAYLWILLLQPNGLINQFLGIVGIDGPTWLTSSTWAMPALILMSFWGLGTTMIIYLAALQGIPQHLYEAASVDGAGVVRKMWHVTVPMMTPAIFLTAVLQIIGSWQVFTQALIVTNGGPRDSTLFILLHLYRTGFEYFQMGYASAIAWVLFMIILVFTIIQFTVARRWVYYEGATER
jgi:multiple sugar transport system permease protein